MDKIFLKKDMQFIILNCFVNRLPSWHVRKFFYTMSGLKIDKDARIGIKTVLVSPERIKVGARSVINDHCILDGSGGIEIGKDVSVSAYSKIYSCTHRTESEIFEYVTNPVVIKDNVWIAAGVTILDGSIINEMAVIGASSCFKGVADRGYIYYGNPAVLKKKRELIKKYKIDFHPHFR